MDFKLILDFLAELRENNNREWMEANKPRYKKVKEAFNAVTADVINGIAEVDESLFGVEPKHCVFRINRDIRFSKDKSPYKINMGAFIAEGGRKSEHAGYYFHLQPGDETMIAGGIYMPPAPNLAKIRQEIDYNAAELKKILDEKTFKSHFKQIEGEKLKRAPKGYPVDHPNIELLKLKSYIVWRKVKDKEMLKPGALEEIISTFRVIQPFNEYLNVAIS
ncbi:MAG: DUF2461 domain-containing protein [Bacteroidota bacterium]